MGTKVPPTLNQQYNCPICLTPPSGPFVTRCAHTFCYECITTHLATRKNCPLCGAFVTTETITPHFQADANCSSPVVRTTTTSTPPLLSAPHVNPSQSISNTPTTPTAAPTARTPDITDQLSSRRTAPPPLPRHTEAVVASRSSPSTLAARRIRAARAMAAMDQPVVANTSAGPSMRREDSSLIPTESAGSDGRSQYHHPQSEGSHLQGAMSDKTVPHFSNAVANPEALLTAAGENLSTEQLASVIARLNQKLQEKAGKERRVENELLLDFLQHTREEKQSIINRLKAEVEFLDTDMKSTEVEKSQHPQIENLKTRSALSKREGATSSPGQVPDGRSSSGDVTSQQHGEQSEFSSKRQRLSQHYDVLQNHYFSTVAQQKGDARNQALRRFKEDIFKLTQYNQFRSRATLVHVARVPDPPIPDVFRASNIISSIEFDRESEFLATAGVTRRIKIFEFANITRNLADVHYPVKEITTSAKLSWVCWNPYIRNHLVSSDYEGFVTLWDVNRSTALREYEEHENRAWSVDYCPANPTYFASGSDDGRVKLWSTSQRESVLTIDNKPANVCSVKFHPTAAEKLAFGSVDFNVHYFDLRNTREALTVFRSHTRAVSYVKFMSGSELVSASVDSTIKLWDLNSMSLARTFTGHMNDKNFVGLSVTSDYIACGSEENAVYCYYKAIPRPFTWYRFPSVDPLTGEETQDDDESQFVSSVCWCPKGPAMLVGANSLGAMKVLALEASPRDRNEDE